MEEMVAAFNKRGRVWLFFEIVDEPEARSSSPEPGGGGRRALKLSCRCEWITGGDSPATMRWPQPAQSVRVAIRRDLNPRLLSNETQRPQ
jgi:hypothetical protein